MSSSTRRLFQKKSIRNLSIALLFFVSLFFILSTSLNPEKFDLEVGQKAPEDIKAPKDIEDKISTERARQEVASTVKPVYKLNPGVHVEVKKDIENFFLLVYRLREDEELTETEKITQLTSKNDLNIGMVSTRVAITAPSEKLKYLESYINEIATQNMNAGINVEDLQRQKSSIKEYITNLDEFDNELKDLAISIIYATIRPNKFLDEEATNRGIELARENVDKVIIRKGDNIIREGETITSDRLELLGELGILTDKGRVDFVLYIGIAAMVLVIELLTIAYIMAFNKGLLAKPKRLLMVYIIFIFTLIISRAVQGISIYLIPIAASSMLLSILLESRLALLINLCLTILVSIITGNNITFIAMALVGGTVGAFSVINTQQRANIFVSGLAIGVINMVTIVGIGFINSSEVMETLMSGFYGLLNGLFCSILTVGSLPAWESVFSIVTPLKLLELSNPNQPLLKKLLIEAPGTYHHSIIVGN
ncbi:MAG: phosphohydrolase, partial [Clostridiales bacterium]|nr:phosphohydrolase [Clostridiales bacterium]